MYYYLQVYIRVKKRAVDLSSLLCLTPITWKEKKQDTKGFQTIGTKIYKLSWHAIYVKYNIGL